MAKVTELVAILEKRIQRGDYALGGLPTEQQLAEEVGVSRMTARRMILQLMKTGLVVRRPHGRLTINPDHIQQSGRLRLAFLSPAFSSPDFENWRFAVERAAQKRVAAVRMVDYVHWDDPVISQTLAEFDGVFLVTSSETIPTFVRDRLRLSQNLVALGQDLSDCGVPSLDLLPPVFIQLLGDHLYHLGHRSIDCFNTQPRDPVIVKRIEQWQFWQNMRKTQGRLIDAPVAPYSNPTPAAYKEMKRLLAAGEFKATALLCITGSAATGAIRALYEAGVRVPQDVSVCSLEGDGLAEYQIPSRTSLEQLDATPYLDVCVDWMAKKNEPWVGPLLIQPDKVPLFHGESTGPVPAHPKHLAHG